MPRIWQQFVRKYSVGAPAKLTMALSIDFALKNSNSQKADG